MLKIRARKTNLNKLPVKQQASSACLFYACSQGWRNLARLGAIILLLSLLSSCEQCPAFAEPITLKASWYSTQSLHKDGQWKITHGRMSNGEYFDDNLLVCATRLYPIGAWLRITNIQNGKTVDVRVADRIGKRFAKTRIDLPKGIFAKIADCKQGIISVMVKKL